MKVIRHPGLFWFAPAVVAIVLALLIAATRSPAWKLWVVFMILAAIHAMLIAYRELKTDGVAGWKFWLLILPLTCLVLISNALLGSAILGAAGVLFTDLD